jgi:hypothetical protein
MSRLPTVQIYVGDRVGFINEADFDPKKHRIFSGKPEDLPGREPDPTPSDRELLEERAKAAEVEFHPNISDEKLLERVEAAEAAQEPAPAPEPAPAKEPAKAPAKKASKAK